MEYFIKSKIVVATLSKESLKEFNLGNNVLVLASRTIWNTFALSDFFGNLDNKKNFHIYHHIRPDAPFEDLDIVLDGLTDKKPDTIVAIGGGSIIDAAKALSISFEGKDYKDIFYKKTAMPEQKIKTLAIPTTGGTGAELSFGAILYDSINGFKGGIRGEIVQPDGILIDARFHNACPFKLKAEVGFDCLTHAVETYISTKSNPLVRDQSINCIRNIFRYLTTACKKNNLEAMEKIAISSAMMGINLAYSSTCLPHRIQYVIGPMTGTSHAQGLIALYKGWLAHLAEKDVKAFNCLSRDLEMDKFQFIEQVQSLKKELNINYSISYLGIKETQIEEIARKVTGNLSADPSYFNTDSIINILKKAL